MIGPEHPAWRRLNDFVEEAIRRQPPELAVKAQQLWDSGQYKLEIWVGVDDQKRADPNTLTYIVQLPSGVGGGWTNLCRVHHSLLGLPDDEVIAESRSLLWQHGVGLPDDARELTDP
jgi:hypothetical protein